MNRIIDVKESEKVFYDFDMDSVDYVSLIIVGQVEIKDILMKVIQ